MGWQLQRHKRLPSVCLKLVPCDPFGMDLLIISPLHIWVQPAVGTDVVEDGTAGVAIEGWLLHFGFLPWTKNSPTR